MIVNSARISRASRKRMAMHEYPTVLIGDEVSLLKGSRISTLARNIDCEASQWRRALRVIRGIA